MIRLQIVERSGANLFSTLKRAMRSKELQTFSLAKGGRRVVHVNYPGWMAWSSSPGAILCEIVNPREPGTEWRLLHAFIGRLADRYAGLVHSVSIDFPGVAEGAPAKRARRAKRTRPTRRVKARRRPTRRRTSRRVVKRATRRTARRPTRRAAKRAPKRASKPTRRRPRARKPSSRRSRARTRR